ncbi:hypothetical protein MMC19_003763, partial [Ptychographa xylographoides]|nr:hypothetical protein [Ptychographa xylographoides]
MNLSNLVHDNHRRLSPQPQPTQLLAGGGCRPISEEMASIMTATSYSSQQSPIKTTYPRSPKPPPSPPGEDSSGRTLPSIQSLIGMADASSGQALQT